MPRPGPRRIMLGVKIKPESMEVIDELAKAEKVSRSEMARRLMAEAIAARKKVKR